MTTLTAIVHNNKKGFIAIKHEAYELNESCLIQKLHKVLKRLSVKEIEKLHQRFLSDYENKKEKLSPDQLLDTLDRFARIYTKFNELKN